MELQASVVPLKLDNNVRYNPYFVNNLIVLVYISYSARTYLIFALLTSVLYCSSNRRPEDPLHTH